MAGKGERAGDKRGGSRHAGAFFFVICYYYTNEYLRTQCVTNGVGREQIGMTGVTRVRD